MTLLSQAPAGLLAGAVVATALMVTVSGVLAWHWLRRVLDVPRITRPPGMYMALALAWGALALGSAATIMAALLLRDHQPLAGRTQVGELRCHPTADGHVRLEIANVGASLPANREQYDGEGESCVVSVKEVALRPGLRALGLGALARIESVGSAARPTANPAWLTPVPAAPGGVLGLVVQQTRAVQIVVRADSEQRYVVVAAPGQQPALQPASVL
jgi:hypothetical protein